MTQTVIDDASTFGRVVRSVRKERGLSQRALAGLCGCSQRFVSELERGKSTAELGKALQVLSVLGLSLVVQRESPSMDGRDAVDRLAASVSAKLEKRARIRTSLSDYLGGDCGGPA